MAEKTPHTICRDGSSTLFSESFGQFYHNPNGAVTESIHVFMEQNGLIHRFSTQRPDHPLHVLEIGFGTGLNTFLIADHYLKNDYSFPLHIHSVEAFPIDAATAEKLNYDHGKHAFDFNVIRKIFSSITSGTNTIPLHSEKDITLHLFAGNFQEWSPETNHADFILHDPFSPDVNAELWTPETFTKLRNHASDSACLSTYSSASKARAAMAMAGWIIYRVPGALGKREMSLAFTQEQDIPFKRVNEQRLIERWLNGDFNT